MKNKRNIFLLASLFFVAPAVAQTVDIEIPEWQPTVLALPDIDQDEHLVSEDSLFVMTEENFDSTKVPCAELYNFIWHQSYVNPYNLLDATKFKDTVRIDVSQYHHPFKNYVTSDFGFRRGGRFHYGIDIKLQIGDSVASAFDGMVRIVQEGKGYGNYVVVRHFNGLETVYAHLSETLVAVNQYVKGGEIIALGGNTGRSTGSHLHFEVRYLGQPIPPRSLIDFDNYVALNSELILAPKTFAYAKETAKTQFYTVRKGDTLSHIAARTGVSVSRLCQLNKISRTSILRIGQKIRTS